jgi:hypothetical protein
MPGSFGKTAPTDAAVTGFDVSDGRHERGVRPRGTFDGPA